MASTESSADRIQRRHHGLEDTRLEVTRGAADGESDRLSFHRKESFRMVLCRSSEWKLGVFMPSHCQGLVCSGGCSSLDIGALLVDV